MGYTAMQKRVVLITGASTGIGLALTQLLRQQTDYRVIATARASSMHRFAEAGLADDAHLMLYPLDVCNETQRMDLDYAIKERFGHVDILINNAGVCHRAVIEHLENKDEAEQLAVNYQAAMSLCRLVIPDMRKQRDGLIINISSVGGMMAMPTMGAYSASKFALEGASEALWYEMRPWNVKVVLLEPGFIHSNAFQNAQYSAAAIDSQLDPYDPYFKFYYYLNQLIAKGMDLSPSTPDTIARRIFKIFNEADPHFRIPATLDAWIFRILRKFLPRRFYHRMLYANIPHIQEFIGDSASSSGQHPLPQSLPESMPSHH